MIALVVIAALVFAAAAAWIGLVALEVQGPRGGGLSYLAASLAFAFFAGIAVAKLAHEADKAIGPGFPVAGGGLLGVVVVSAFVVLLFHLRR